MAKYNVFYLAGDAGRMTPMVLHNLELPDYLEPDAKGEAIGRAIQKQLNPKGGPIVGVRIESVVTLK